MTTVHAQLRTLLFIFIFFKSKTYYLNKWWIKIAEYREKKIQAINNSVDVKNRFPIFTQNVQTYIAFQINIWMVHLNVCYNNKEINQLIWYGIQWIMRKEPYGCPGYCLIPWSCTWPLEVHEDKMGTLERWKWKCLP